MAGLRILCLHGYHGSAAVMRAQMRPLTAGWGSLADLVYVDAPSLSAGDFGWWHAVQDEASSGLANGPTPARYVGWPRTRDEIVALFEQEESFDGVLGFSQGATLTSLLVGLRSPQGKPSAERPLTFDFAIMVGGSLSRDPSHADLYQRRECFDLPSLHLLGRRDIVVPASQSRALSRRFSDPVVLEHEGGHLIAATPATRRHVAGFLEDMTARKRLCLQA